MNFEDLCVGDKVSFVKVRKPLEPLQSCVKEPEKDMTVLLGTVVSIKNNRVKFGLDGLFVAFGLKNGVQYTRYSGVRYIKFTKSISRLSLKTGRMTEQEYILGCNYEYDCPKTGKEWVK